MIYAVAIVVATAVTTGAFRLTYGPHWLSGCADDCVCPAARAIVSARANATVNG